MLGTCNNRDIFIQDQVTPSFNWKFSNKLNTFTWSGTINRGDTQFTATAGHNIVIGNWLEFQIGTFQFQVEVAGVIDNLITLALPFPITLPYIAGTYNRVSIDANVNGSVTPVEFTYENKTTLSYDVYFITSVISSSTEGDGGKFGGIAALTNGCQFYKINPTRNFDSYAYNIKKNSCFVVNGFNVIYTDKGGGGGTYSVNVEIAFNEKHGVAIRFLPNEKIVIKVNDNLSSLTGYRSSILGHIVD
jgi:hypothetical protein